jgi:hypothetical protein
LLDCFWQPAHLVVSLAHSFFADSHWSLVHFSTCVGIEAFDESAAEVAGAGLVLGGDAEVCAMAALDRSAARNAAVRQKPIRDMRVSSFSTQELNGGVEKTLHQLAK